MKKYLEDLKTALNETKRFTEAEIREILADHEEMINEALASGLAEANLESKLGKPSKVAADLADSCGSKPLHEAKKNDGNVAFTGVPPAGKFDVAIRLASEDVSVTAEARADIVVYYEGSAPVDRYEIGFSGNEFTIKLRKGDFGGWFRRGTLSFDVRVPKSATIGDIVIQTASGDYRLAGTKADRLKVSAASGDGELCDGAFDDVAIASVNGDLRMARLILGALDVTQVSGDLSLAHLVCEHDIRVNSTSGDIRVEDSTCVEAVFHTVSGDLEGTEFYPESVSLSSVSGDVNIENADRNRPIRVKSSKSISGEVRIREK